MRLRLIIFMVVFTIVVHLQAQTGNGVLLFDTDDTIIQLDLRTLVQTVIVEKPANALLVAHNGDIWYFLQGNYPGPNQVQPRKLVRYNQVTGLSETIFQRDNLVGSSISPDNRYVALGYYTGSMPYGGYERCLLNLTTFECPLLPDNDSTPIWFNGQMLVSPRAGFDPVTTFGLLNPTNFQLTLLNIPSSSLNINNLSLLNNQSSILFGRGLDLFVYDLNLQQLTELPYDAEVNERYGTGSSIIAMEVSPTKQYLAYTNKNDMSIVDFVTGTLVKKFSIEDGGFVSFHSLIWQDDDTLIMGTAIGIQRYTISTNTLQSMSYDNNVSFLSILPNPVNPIPLPPAPATYTPMPPTATFTPTNTP